jgi:hypothetical protein
MSKRKKENRREEKEREERIETKIDYYTIIDNINIYCVSCRCECVGFRFQGNIQ